MFVCVKDGGALDRPSEPFRGAHEGSCWSIYNPPWLLGAGSSVQCTVEGRLELVGRHPLVPYGSGPVLEDIRMRREGRVGFSFEGAVRDDQSKV